MKKGVCAALMLAACLSACGQHYVTPGARADLAGIVGGPAADNRGASLYGRETDSELDSLYGVQPAARFPANIAVVRVQDSGYRTMSSEGYGQGRFTIVTARDVETEEQVEKLRELSDVRGVAPIGRMLVPVNANTIRDLRVPAAKLQADMVLIYTIDTKFSVAGKSYGPLSTISLGLLPNKKAHVAATVSGILVDVRTGFIYGTAEATSRQQKRANLWSTQQAVETARLEAEKLAFAGFVDEFCDFWSHIDVSGNTDVLTRQVTPEGKRYFSVDFRD